MSEKLGDIDQASLNKLHEDGGTTLEICALAAVGKLNRIAEALEEMIDFAKEQNAKMEAEHSEAKAAMLKQSPR